MEAAETSHTLTDLALELEAESRDEEYVDESEEDSGDGSYSDWEAVQVTRQRQSQRQSQRSVRDRTEQRRRRYNPRDDEEDDQLLEGSSGGGTPAPSPVRRGRDSAAARRVARVKRKLRWQDYLPSPWLGTFQGEKSPYLPQIKDRIVWFRQGHEEYIEKADATGWFNAR